MSMSVIPEIAFGAKEAGGKIYCLINRAALAALDYPEYVAYMLLYDGRLIVQAGEKGKRFSAKAVIGARDDEVKIGGKSLINLVFGAMKWDRNSVYKATGRFAGKPAVVTFNLNEAVIGNA